MEKLIKQLKKGIKKLGTNYDLSSKTLDSLYSVFPFNKFEYTISHLIAENVINLSQYLEMRNAYFQRNKFLYVFEITAPRTFGETWAQRHLNELVQELNRPSQLLDPDYVGQYDFWYQGIRIEVKASRVVKRKSGESLILKALSSDSKEGFDMNFQQIKPLCCDVFVWIAVWRDSIKYWVLSSKDILENKYFSTRQHRGNIGEGQLWVTNANIYEFECYRVQACDILRQIVIKSKVVQ